MFPLSTYHLIEKERRPNVQLLKVSVPHQIRKIKLTPFGRLAFDSFSTQQTCYKISKTKWHQQFYLQLLYLNRCEIKSRVTTIQCSSLRTFFICLLPHPLLQLPLWSWNWNRRSPKDWVQIRGHRPRVLESAAFCASLLILSFTSFSSLATLSLSLCSSSSSFFSSVSFSKPIVQTSQQSRPSVPPCSHPCRLCAGFRRSKFQYGENLRSSFWILRSSFWSAQNP